MAEPPSIIEIARRLWEPNICPVCRQDWRQAGCSHQVLSSIEHLCLEDLDTLCDAVEYFNACMERRELVRCLRKQFPV